MFKFAKECPSPEKTMEGIIEYITEPQNGISVDQLRSFAFVYLRTSATFVEDRDKLMTLIGNQSLTQQWIVETTGQAPHHREGGEGVDWTFSSASAQGAVSVFECRQFPQVLQPSILISRGCR